MTALTAAIVEAFEEGVVAHTGEDRTSEELAQLVNDVPALGPAVAGLRVKIHRLRRQRRGRVCAGGVAPHPSAK